ncbi:hypothetical protein B1A61_04185, partial [Corynebacterium diphtheriae]
SLVKFSLACSKIFPSTQTEQNLGHFTDYCVAEGWFCLDSGAQLVLINDGGWRHAESSKFRLLWCSPNDDIRDLTPVSKTATSSTQRKPEPQHTQKLLMRVAIA